MNGLDGRKINLKALEEIRIRTVKCVKAGESPEVVFKALGIIRPRIYEWIAKYREGGIVALRSRKAPDKTPKLWAFQPDELLVVEWLAKDFPAMKKFAREQQAEIYFGDESSVRSDNHSGTTCAPRRKTPVVTTTGSGHKVNLISAIIPRGSMLFLATEDNVDSSVFITFLKRLIAEAKQPIFMIVDHHSVHRSSEVRDFAMSRQGGLRLFKCRRALRSLSR